jgi:hypothetical protein
MLLNILKSYISTPSMSNFIAEEGELESGPFQMVKYFDLIFCMNYQLFETATVSQKPQQNAPHKTA